MWLFTKDSFVSIVQHREVPNVVIVRARRKEDIERLFPHKSKKYIKVDGKADYPYRLLVGKYELGKVLTNYVDDQLTYDNFKNAQAKDAPPTWKNFLYEIWALVIALKAKSFFIMKNHVFGVKAVLNAFQGCCSSGLVTTPLFVNQKYLFCGDYRSVKEIVFLLFVANNVINCIHKAKMRIDLVPKKQWGTSYMQI